MIGSSFPSALVICSLLAMPALSGCGRRVDANGQPYSEAGSNARVVVIQCEPTPAKEAK